MWFTKDGCPVKEADDTEEEMEEAWDRYLDYCQEREDILRGN